MIDDTGNSAILMRCTPERLIKRNAEAPESRVSRLTAAEINELPPIHVFGTEEINVSLLPLLNNSYMVTAKKGGESQQIRIRVPGDVMFVDVTTKIEEALQGADIKDIAIALQAIEGIKQWSQNPSPQSHKKEQAKDNTPQIIPFRDIRVTIFPSGEENLYIISIQKGDDTKGATTLRHRIPKDLKIVTSAIATALDKQQPNGLLGVVGCLAQTIQKLTNPERDR